MNRWILSVCGLMLALSACSKETEPVSEQLPDPPAAAAPTPTPASSAPAAPSAASAAIGAEPATQVPEDQLPTEEDFEQEAEQKISASNLESALAELEGEIKD